MNENLQKLTGATTRVITHQDEEYLFFGGTAYLGLIQNAAFIHLYKQGLDVYGLNNGTSRNNNVQIDIYDQAESAMAQRFGYPECILVSSGYLAAQLVIQTLTGLGEFIYAPGAHPALWQNASPVSVEQTFEEWVDSTVAYINRSSESCFVIVSNTLDNLTPATFDFSGFTAIEANKELYFILDDSHGIGVKGAGTCFVDLSNLQRDNMHIVLIASLAKGMGTDAGAILCSTEQAALFRRSTFFTGASPSSPASMYALLHGQEIFRQQSELLQQHIDYLDRHVDHRVHRIPHFPVFTVANKDAFQYFKKNKILISSFSYPLPSDPPINRIVLSAGHRQEDLVRLAEVLNNF